MSSDTTGLGWPDDERSDNELYEDEVLQRFENANGPLEPADARFGRARLRHPEVRLVGNWPVALTVRARSFRLELRGALFGGRNGVGDWKEVARLRRLHPKLRDVWEQERDRYREWWLDLAPDHPAKHKTKPRRLDNEIGPERLADLVNDIREKPELGVRELAEMYRVGKSSVQRLKQTL